MNFRFFFLTIIIILSNHLLYPMGKRAPDTKPVLDDILSFGKLAKGEESYSLYAKAHRNDASAWFELGIVRFIRSVERLAQGVYKLGPLPESHDIPFLRLPVPPNQKSETATYEKFRTILDRFSHDMEAVLTTFSAVPEGEIRVPLHIGKVRMDIDGDGVYADQETMRMIFTTYTGITINPEEADDFQIVFDRADVHWLAGYCNLLHAICDLILAYDFRGLFDFASPYLFTKTNTDVRSKTRKPNLDKILVLATVDEGRKRRAIDHLLAMIAESRACFESAASETDDEFEWIPNPAQTGVLPNMRVSRQMISSWKEFLDEAESILTGRKLVPLGSANEQSGKGLNIRRLLLEQKQLDLQEIIFKGENPAIEKGNVTKQSFWSRLFFVFAGNFIGFAIWFN
jgi:hypothetical protein